MSDPKLAEPTQQSAIHVTAERWPLVQVRFVGFVDGPAFDRYLEQLTRAITLRPGHRVLLMDASAAGIVSAQARRKQAEWMRIHEQTTRELTAGIAFVLPSALLRGALTAILWLQPLNCPHAVVHDVSTALARCRAWLEPHGLTIPS